MRQYPFWGSLTMNLELEPTDDKWCSTAATDGDKIYYNRKFFESFPEAKRLDYIQFVLAHEVGHCIFKHMERLGGREKNKWNIATDAVINQTLVDQQPPFQMPVLTKKDNGIEFQGILDEKWRGLAAEEVYKLLKDTVKYQKFDEHCYGKGGKGQKDDEGKPVFRHDARDWGEAVERAAAVAKSQGNLPAGLDRLVKFLKPRISWKTVLNTFVDTISKTDYNMRIPNRRAIVHGYYAPALHQPELGEIAVAIDSSGSIDEQQFSQFVGELQGVRDAYDCTVHTYICDAEVHHYKVFLPGEPLQLKLAGGGGTDFRPVFSRIKKDCPNIKCLLYLTDAWGSFPEKKPDYPVLWILTKEHGAVPFGQQVYMDNV